jgi:hypothetical protein
MSWSAVWKKDDWIDPLSDSQIMLLSKYSVFGFKPIHFMLSTFPL